MWLRSRRFNRLKFVPIVLARSFRSHFPTVGPNFTVTVKNYPRLIYRPTECGISDNLRLSFLPDASFLTGPILHPIYHPIRRAMGCRVYSSDIHAYIVLFLVTYLSLHSLALPVWAHFGI